MSQRNLARAAAMESARRFFRAKEIAYEQPNGWTFKVGPYNYWPHKKKVFKDGDPASQNGVGLQQLELLLIQEGIPSQPTSTVSEDWPQ